MRIKLEFRNLALLLLLLASPLLAQDEGGGGGLPSSLFGGDAPISSRGNEANPMEAVKKFLAQATVTLSGDQERTLKPTIESAFRLVQDTVEKYSAQTGPRAARGDGGFRGQRAPGGEGRRGGRGGGLPPQNPQLAAELQKINDDVLGRITGVLKPDQQAAFKKWQNDVIKKGGGFPALKIVMEEAGAPLTTEQEPQIQAIYAEALKTAEPELTTMTKVAKLLTAAQRKALLDSRAKQQ